MAKGSRGGKRASSSAMKASATISQVTQAVHNPFEPDDTPIVDTSKYNVPFDNQWYGSVSKVTAGQVYKAYKNGNIEVLRETINSLYDEANDHSPYGIKYQRYHQNPGYYDILTILTQALLNQDYKSAQHLINQIEYEQIRLSGSKSSYYKYKSKLKEED